MVGATDATDPEVGIMIRGRRPLNEPRANCAWCRSADSVEYGICQVCLAEYPLDTEIIDLAPTADRRAHIAPADALRVNLDARDDEPATA